MTSSESGCETAHRTQRLLMEGTEDEATTLALDAVSISARGTVEKHHIAPAQNKLRVLYAWKTLIRKSY